MYILYIKNDRGPKTDPWGTPAVMFAQEEVWPLSTTLCFLLFTDMSFSIILKIIPWCQTLSKALDISKKRFLLQINAFL